MFLSLAILASMADFYQEGVNLGEKLKKQMIEVKNQHPS
jgi:hypothetical protein